MDRKQGERLCDELNDIFATYQQAAEPLQMFPCKAYIEEDKLIVDLNGNLASATLVSIADAYGVEDFLRGFSKEFLPHLRFAILAKSYEGLIDGSNPYKGSEDIEDLATVVHLITEYLFAIGICIEENATEIAERVCGEGDCMDVQNNVHLYA